MTHPMSHGHQAKAPERSQGCLTLFLTLHCYQDGQISDENAK